MARLLKTALILWIVLSAVYFSLSISEVANRDVRITLDEPYPNSEFGELRGVPNTSFVVATGVTGTAWMFALNFVLNLVLCSAFLLILAPFDRVRTRRLDPTALRYIEALLICAAAIAVVATCVEYYLMMGNDYPPVYLGIPLLHYTESRVIDYNALNWISGFMVLLVLSIALISGIMKVSRRRSVTIGGSVCGANVLWWIGCAFFGLDIPLISLVAGSIVAPVLLRGIVENFLKGPSDCRRDKFEFVSNAERFGHLPGPSVRR